MQYDHNNRIHRLVLAGLLTAFILALTMVISIPIPNLAGAYVNLGDAGVYLAAFVLGTPWGALCAAMGSALADLLLGSAIYILPTFLIKGAMAWLAALLLKNMHGKRLLPLAMAGLCMPMGYFLFESILYGPGAALAGVGLNLVQYAIGVVLGVPVIRMADHYLTTMGKKKA